MNSSRCRARIIAREIKTAEALHAVEYPAGNYAAANERLGRCSRLAEQVIRDAGIWPKGVRFLCNDTRFRLLSKLSETQVGR